MITNFKIFEKINYTSEQLQLMRKLRYTLNKAFDCKCGVGNATHVVSNDYPYYYIPYSGETILFEIYIPGIQYSLLDKDMIFKKITKEIGLMNDGSIYIGTKEQMEELIFRLKYIDTIKDTEKYNL